MEQTKVMTVFVGILRERGLEVELEWHEGTWYMRVGRGENRWTNRATSNREVEQWLHGIRVGLVIGKGCD